MSGKTSLSGLEFQLLLDTLWRHREISLPNA